MAVVNDPFDFERFVEAQDSVYDRVCAELRSGRKSSHWMWFIFPQLRGLGSSSMAETFGIASRDRRRARQRENRIDRELRIRPADRNRHQSLRQSEGRHAALWGVDPGN